MVQLFSVIKKVDNCLNLVESGPNSVHTGCISCERNIGENNFRPRPLRYIFAVRYQLTVSPPTDGSISNPFIDRLN